MKTYEIIIKSHCDVPDYEDQCQAESFYEAAKIFQDRMMSKSEDYWSLKEIGDQMYKETVSYKYYQ